jgi:predicted ArsR family transcriptional regulator
LARYPETVADRAFSGAKRRVLDRLKQRGSSTVGEVAADLGLTSVAVRQHLAELEREGLVHRGAATAGGVGRPAATWSLTELAEKLFPDHHAELVVELLEAVRAAAGDKGLARVIDARRATQLESYRRLVGGRSMAGRAESLARQRTVEGYMASVERDHDGLLLVERHCPICDAARACGGLCESELELFKHVLGDDVSVTRVEHLVAGDRRCAYRIVPSTD